MDDLFKSLDFEDFIEKSTHDDMTYKTFNFTSFPHPENETQFNLGDLIKILSNLTAKNSVSSAHRSAEILSKPETIVTLVLCFLAFCVNMISICATCNIPNGLTTHSKLIISLATSDILVTISVFAHLIIKMFNQPLNPLSTSSSERLSSSCQFAFVSSLNIMAHLISLLNLLMMAIDHYFAIMRPLHYIYIMNKRNGFILIFIMWLLATMGGFLNFLTGIASFSNHPNSYMNYCEYIMYNDFYGDYLVIACTFLCLISICFIYLRIYCEVKRITNRIQILQYDEEHSSKTLVTTLLIIGTFVVCWIPIISFNLVIIIQLNLDFASVKKTFKVLLLANKYLYALLLVNSICDPVIYAVRLREVQLGYFRFLKKTRELLKKRKPKRKFSRCVIHSQIETEPTCGIEEYHMELSNCLPAIDNVQTGYSEDTEKLNSISDTHDIYNEYSENSISNNCAETEISLLTNDVQCRSVT